MMKKYLRWKAEWLCGIPHGSINWALVPACPSNLGKDLVLSACWCVFYFVFELFLSCSKLQWCVVEFQELWWDRHHWWQPMKATTLKQTVWTWMVRLPDGLCKHQPESDFSDICSVTLLLYMSFVQPPTEDIAQFLFALFVKHTLSGCKVALGWEQTESVTHWQSQSAVSQSPLTSESVTLRHPPLGVRGDCTAGCFHFHMYEYIYTHACCFSNMQHACLFQALALQMIAHWPFLLNYNST